MTSSSSQNYCWIYKEITDHVVTDNGWGPESGKVPKHIRNLNEIGGIVASIIYWNISVVYLILWANTRLCSRRYCLLEYPVKPAHKFENNFKSNPEMKLRSNSIKFSCLPGALQNINSGVRLTGYYLVLAQACLFFLYFFFCVCVNNNRSWKKNKFYETWKKMLDCFLGDAGLENQNCSLRRCIFTRL